MRLEERDDGRLAFAFCDGQWRVSVLRRPIDLGTLVQHQPRRVDVARLLLDKGAKVKRAAENGSTPLSIAKDNGHSAVVALLKERTSLWSRVRSGLTSFQQVTR